MTGYRFDAELAPWAARSSAVRLDDLALVRAQLEAAAGRPYRGSGAPVVEDRTVPGVPPVPVRIYTPTSAGRPLGALVYFHGGGFVLGSIELADQKAVRYATEAGVVVVSVGYRLAPEHPFPAGLEDGFAVLSWLAEHAAGLGVAPERIGVGGNSAGAGLAAALALLARDRGGPALRFQFLDSPVLDDRLRTPSMLAFDDTPSWDRGAAAASWRYYLGDVEPGSTGVSPYAAPSRATDLAGLPAAHVTACEFDPVRDEAIEYAQRLVQAGVSADLRLYAGTFHGSIWVAEAEVSRRMFTDQMTALRRGLR